MFFFFCAFEKLLHCSFQFFFRFPKNEPIQRFWLVAIGRDEFQPTCPTHICDAYFKDNDLSGKTVTLKRNAVPSIFNFPEHLKVKKIKR